jgi:PBP1b-binding outer membrane lipoprotein LpoB
MKQRTVLATLLLAILLLASCAPAAEEEVASQPAGDDVEVLVYSSPA